MLLCCAFDECSLPHVLDTEDFGDATHCDIFKAIQKQFAEKQRCSYVDLCGQFSDGLLMSIMNLDACYWPSPEEDVARMLREFRIRRIAAKFSVTIGEAKNMIDQFSEQTKKLTELLPHARRDTLDVFNQLHDKPAPWIPTGFPSIDKYVHMHLKNLVTIGARTRHGKSSFLMNMAVHAMQRKERVDFLTKEMSDLEVLPRIIECMTGMKFEKGKECVDTEVLSRLNIHTVSSVQTVASIAAKSDAKLILVDYIQILSSGRRIENRVSELEYITGKLKEIAVETDKCIVCASQINRTLDTTDRDPVLSDLRGSGSIEQDSNIVIFLYNNLEEDKSGKQGAKQTARNLEGKKDDVTVIIAKNRLGESGRCSLGWDGETCRFLDTAAPLLEYSQLPNICF